jgi:hypothetical protein
MYIFLCDRLHLNVQGHFRSSPFEQECSPAMLPLLEILIGPMSGNNMQCRLHNFQCLRCPEISPLEGGL